MHQISALVHAVAVFLYVRVEKRSVFSINPAAKSWNGNGKLWGRWRVPCSQLHYPPRKLGGNLRNLLFKEHIRISRQERHLCSLRP